MTQHPDTTVNPNAAQIAALNELAKKIEAGVEIEYRFFRPAFPVVKEGANALSAYQHKSVDAFIALKDAVLGERWEWELKHVLTLSGEKHGKALIYGYPYGDPLQHSATHREPAIAGLLALIAAKVSELEAV